MASEAGLLYAPILCTVGADIFRSRASWPRAILPLDPPRIGGETMEADGHCVHLAIIIYHHICHRTVAQEIVVGNNTASQSRLEVSAVHKEFHDKLVQRI
jgi:hypothetical protein